MSGSAIHTEKAFEDAIEADMLTGGGYAKGQPEDFDPALALIPADLLAFVRDSQTDLWAALEKDHGSDLPAGLLQALQKHLSDRGTLDVLRHGFKFFGKRIRAAAFRPAHGLNPELRRQYDANRLVVTRQVPLSAAGSESVDMLVSLNGLPIATLELKNSLTGQTAAHARKQYEQRDPKLPLLRFKERALVHFAVDTDVVSMTTRVAGRGTFWLPFNRGDRGGAGNPLLPGEPYKTAYLWREVLERHSLLDVLARFVHVQASEEQRGGRTRKRETVIFPRYHQLDVVRRLIDAAREEGAGHHYLVQHSAGSGKSNSIAWVAHRLATLHDDADRKVFDSVVIVTDRRVLDRQLQETVYQFEHKAGVVQRIDKDSNQLAQALLNGTPIVITTLQKFPVVAERVAALPDRRYAVIVDEAHSSQSGESARKLRAVLGAGRPDGVDDERVADASPVYGAPPAGPDGQEPEAASWEDMLDEVMVSRGRQRNMSFFAFTATPKAKTLELFGRAGEDRKPRPFHVYSMRQAIEERFILDVLRNYTTYRAYYRLVQRSAEHDPDVNKKKATLALARFASLHPHNIAQKVEVIVEHFRNHVRRKIGGRAKAMVVTRSRLHAVRFKRAFDAYVREKGYADTHALVAFSGRVVDPDGGEYTEPAMNDGLPESQVPEAFRSDDNQVLIVAEKYQTGFDEPLLCAMYVDRRIDGVQAVQTLSRLNRTCPGKEETFVLDFVNDADEIRAAFQPFYEQTTVSETADPYQLEQLRHELDAARIWDESEVEAFAAVFYDRRHATLGDEAHSQLHLFLQPAVDRFLAWDDEETREQWRGRLQSFVRLYAFLSQVMPWTDRELELRFSFGRYLIRRLPRDESQRVDVEDDVDMHSYRLARLGETDIALDPAGEGEVKGPTAVGTGAGDDPEVPLHEVIDLLNERFGTDFTEADQLLFDQVVADAKADERVQARARANSYENFALGVRSRIEGLMIDRMDRNASIVTKFLNEEDFKAVLVEHLARRMYEELHAAN